MLLKRPFFFLISIWKIFRIRKRVLLRGIMYARWNILLLRTTEVLFAQQMQCEPIARSLLGCSTEKHAGTSQVLGVCIKSFVSKAPFYKGLFINDVERAKYKSNLLYFRAEELI